MRKGGTPFGSRRQLCSREPGVGGTRASRLPRSLPRLSQGIRACGEGTTAVPAARLDSDRQVSPEVDTQPLV